MNRQCRRHGDSEHREGIHANDDADNDPVEAGNRAIADGTLQKTLEATMERLKPEAAYFIATGGERSALLFFDLADASDIPPIAEPIFRNLNASVEFSPVMNAEDLQAGLGRLG